MAIKKMSDAFKKVQVYRDNMNIGRTKIMAKDLSCVVYIYENVYGHPCAVGYRGRAKKPAFHYRYPSDERRAERVQEWMAAQSETKTTGRQPVIRTLSVDDVLRASWGYDQTNIDYFKVTGLIGDTMVELVPIGKHSDGGGMTGDCVPDPSSVTGEPIRRKAKGDSVKIDDVRYASKVVPTTIAGLVLYKPDSWSAYH